MSESVEINNTHTSVEVEDAMKVSVESTDSIVTVENQGDTIIEVTYAPNIDVYSPTSTEGLRNPNNPFLLLDAPYPPAGLTGIATGLTQIRLTWAKALYKNHGVTEIWRSETNSQINAELVGTSDTQVFIDNVDPVNSYYYWIRFISMAKVVGSFNKSEGTLVASHTNPSAILALLRDSVAADQLTADLLGPIQSIPTIEQSLSSQINQETLARVAALTAEVEDRQNAIEIAKNEVITDSEAKITQWAAVEQAERSALIAQEQLSRVTEDEALASEILVVKASIEDLDLDFAGVSSGLSSLTTRVTNTEIGLVSQGSSITSLSGRVGTAENKINTLEGNQSTFASATALDLLEQEVSDTETGLSATATKVTQLNNRLKTSTGVEFTADAYQSFQTSVTNALDDRPTTATMTSQISTSVTPVQNQVNQVEEDLGNLDSEVTTLEAGVQVLGESVGGITSKYTMKAYANGVVAGIGLSAAEPDANGIGSRIYFTADQIAFINPPPGYNPETYNPGADPNLNIPFIVQGGSIYFGGGLYGATGTFAGELSAATGSFEGSVFIDSAAFGEAGIQLDPNSGNARAYIGDGGDSFLKYENGVLSLGDDTALIGYEGYNNQGFVYEHVRGVLWPQFINQTLGTIQIQRETVQYPAPPIHAGTTYFASSTTGNTFASYLAPAAMAYNGIRMSKAFRFKFRISVYLTASSDHRNTRLNIGVGTLDGFNFASLQLRVNFDGSLNTRMSHRANGGSTLFTGSFDIGNQSYNEFEIRYGTGPSGNGIEMYCNGFLVGSRSLVTFSSDAVVEEIMKVSFERTGTSGITGVQMGDFKISGST